jgi:hypothetical protein
MQQYFTLLLTVVCFHGSTAQAVLNVPLELEQEQPTLATCLPPVPSSLVAQLLHFEVVTSNKLQADLIWRLRNLDALTHFEVLRSKDGMNFKTYKVIATTSDLVYRFQDREALGGYNYLLVAALSRSAFDWPAPNC